jgi:hypothetical protein
VALERSSLALATWPLALLAALAVAGIGEPGLFLYFPRCAPVMTKLRAFVDAARPLNDARAFVATMKVLAEASPAKGLWLLSIPDKLRVIRIVVLAKQQGCQRMHAKHADGDRFNNLSGRAIGCASAVRLGWRVSLNV